MRKFCAPSGENAISHTDPLPSVSLAMKASLTNVRPVANINEPIVRYSDGMHDAELRGRRAIRLILARPVLMLHRAIEWTWKALARVLEVRIIGLASICAPMTLVRPGLRVEHDDSMIHVSVGNIELVCLLIDFQGSRAAEILRVIAAAVFSAV